MRECTCVWECVLGTNRRGFVNAGNPSHLQRDDHLLPARTSTYTDIHTHINTTGTGAHNRHKDTNVALSSHSQTPCDLHKRSQSRHTSTHTDSTRTATHFKLDHISTYSIQSRTLHTHIHTDSQPRTHTHPSAHTHARRKRRAVRVSV